MYVESDKIKGLKKEANDKKLKYISNIVTGEMKMPELRKILIFIFVSLLFIYMFKLVNATRYKKDKSYVFIIMICGLFLLVVATFSDMIAKIVNEGYIYTIIKMCFTVGSVLYIIGIILWTDVTKKMMDELERMAAVDSLTGALSRNGLKKVFESLSENMASFYLLVCDLDGTKLINDTFGHSEGDKLIYDTSRIMIDSVEDKGHVSRIGGDEFVILLEHCKSSELEEIVFNLKEKIARLYPQNNLGISIGCASFPRDGQSFDELFKTADTRMYKDKDEKRSQMTSEKTAVISASQAV